MPAETIQLIETRLISGRGLFQVPTSEDWRHLYLYVNVARFPRIDFSNSKWNPDRSEYAKITWVRKDYVIKESVVNYAYQLFEFDQDPTGYLATAITCMYEAVIGYFSYLAPFVQAPPLVGDPNDRIYLNPLIGNPELIKIVCRADTAVLCKLYGLKYDLNCPESQPGGDPPPDPPPVPPSLPGVPLGDVSPPYDGESDDGDTTPYPGDEIVPPEGGDTGGTVPGRVYSLAYQVKQFPGGSVLTRAGIWLLGPVGDVRFKPDGSKTVQVWAAGKVPNRFDPPPPQPLAWLDIQDEDDRAVDLVKLSVTDVTP